MGEVFAGRYELADPIGRGGVGAVWRAWDHRRRRYVAAKVLQQSDAHSLLRFVREQALRIDHPHVLAPASWAADDDKVLFTMDLVGGGSLVHLVGDYGPLPPVFVCTLLDQLLSGLGAVHAEGVVHRDIKPANVLLEATGTGRPRLRLSDFGIAMRFGEPRLTETNLVVGTPGYLAPEQLLGSEPDFPADLFAVGLVALYLLEGAKPDAKALVQYFVEHGTPGAPKGVPEPLWQVVAGLLQPDPAARFRTATGARKALASAVELLPEPGLDDEPIEIFDQLGPLPPGFAPEGPLRGPLRTAPRADPRAADTPGPGTEAREDSGSASPDQDQDQEPEQDQYWDQYPGTGGRDTTGSAPNPAADPRRSRSGAQGGAPTDDPRRDGDSLSDTGSFRLPPPQAAEATAPTFTHTPRPAAPPPYAHTPPPAPWAASPLPGTGQPGDSTTAAYTTRAPQAPPAVPRAPRAHGRRARRPERRPGPPAKAAIPILLLALACYAVGFWALTRV